jgi:hypothetical protein
VPAPAHDGAGAREPRLRWPLAVAVVLGTLIACLVPAYDEDHPRRIALYHYDDRATGRAIVAALAIDRLPAPVRQAGSLAEEPGPALPWMPLAMHVGPGTPSTDPPPRLDSIDGVDRVDRVGGAAGEPRRVRARLLSPRGADRAVVLVPPERVLGAWLEGQPVGTASDARGRLLVFGLPLHGWVIDLEIGGSDPIEATVVDCVGGLPDSAASLVAARDAAGAVTIQWGDVGCIATRAAL